MYMNVVTLCKLIGLLLLFCLLSIKLIMFGFMHAGLFLRVSRSFSNEARRRVLTVAFKCPHSFLPSERVGVTMTTTFKRLCICRATRKVVVFEGDGDIRCKIILARQQLPVKYVTVPDKRDHFRYKMIFQ